MDLESYYKINFALLQYHKYSLTEVENLIPWERDIYIGMLKQHLEDEKLKQNNNLMPSSNNLIQSLRSAHDPHFKLEGKVGGSILRCS